MSKFNHIKVCHLSSLHARYDTRIFIKMCSSLSSFGYDVTLVIADGLGDEVKNGVSIVDVGVKTGGRISRITKTVKRVYEKAKELDANIYHLHDPELIPVGLKLKKLGKKIIFDSHEDIPNDILIKGYLKFNLKYLVSYFFRLFQCITYPKFDALVAATPSIRDNLLKFNPNTVDVNNFPLLNELSIANDWSKKEREVAYVGGIAKIRGILEITSAMEYTRDVRLNLVGNFSEKAIEQKIKRHQSWKKVNELGFLTRKLVNVVLAKSQAGLVTLHPIVTYKAALPVKMFEYMVAGIPVIASNFPILRNIVEGNKCGICVDPLNPKVIGETIQFLIDNPTKAQQMGQNGRKAIEQKYNWLIEEQKLLKLYKSFS